MSEKKKNDYYFQIIPEDQFTKFIESFKNALSKAKIKKEKKLCEFEFRTTKEDLKEATTLEIFTFNKAGYFDYFDQQKEYFKNSLCSFSLNLEVKEEAGINILKNKFEEVLKPMFDGIPFTKKYELEIFFRNKDKQVSIDIISKKWAFVEGLLDLGIDITEYHKFNLILKLGINLFEILELKEDINIICEKVLSLIFSIKSETNNIKYILNALIEALKIINLNDAKKQKKNA